MSNEPSCKPELQPLLLHAQPGYMLIKEKDLDKSHLITRERIVFKASDGGRVWYLFVFGDRRHAAMTLALCRSISRFY